MPSYECIVSIVHVAYGNNEKKITRVMNFNYSIKITSYQLPVVGLRGCVPSAPGDLSGLASASGASPPSPPNGGCGNAANGNGK